MRLILPNAALLASVSACSVAAPNDVAAITSGVTEIVAPGCLVGPVAVTGKDAFAVVTGANGRRRLPIIAAARHGRGRVVIGGHEGLYGSPDRANQKRLIVNTVRWLAAGRAQGARVLLAGHGGIGGALREAGFSVSACSIGQAESKLAQTDVLVVDGGELTGRPQLIEQIGGFVEKGGGYFDAVPGWGWQQLNPTLSLAADYGGNRVTARMGLVIADGSVEPTGKQGWLADGTGLADSHAGQALTRLEAGSAGLDKEMLAQIGHVLTNAAGAVPPDDTILLPRLRRLAARGAADVPTPATPLGLDNPIARVACVIQSIEMRRTAVAQLKAHPSSDAFPGAVPKDAARVTQLLDIDTSVPEWHSTGLYAAPGEAITLTIPDAAVGAGLGVRVGAHTDSLWHHDQWQRFPEISYWTHLKQTVTRFGSPFGGLVYITAPDGSKAGRVQVGVAGAVRAPYFVQGVTPVDRWRAEARSYPGPWAELATDKIILTVPSSVVRTLEDPEALMWVWDAGMDAIADLAGIPRQRRRPERICSDQQISAGYMHSGYPIMTWLDVPKVMVDRDAMALGGASKCWGFWHELGHNHQDGAWTFDGTGEVTNNLFSLYCCERVSGESVAKSTWLSPAKRNESVKKYFADGAKFDTWKSDPGLALMFYAQLQQEFGWGAFRRLFADYRASAAGLPRTDDEKRDQFLVRLSRMVGRNLGPFFTAWGVPTSETARRSVESLPAWVPEGLRDGIPVP